MTIVVGIDVGGPRKGFHAVAMEGRTTFKECFHDTQAQKVAAWCASIGANAICVDAPIGWRTGQGSRLAESEMASKKLHFFATPTRARAQQVPFYSWMCNGERMYQALEGRFPRLQDRSQVGNQSLCFESFPHAIAVWLGEKKDGIGGKSSSRRRVLASLGIDVHSLRNIDFVDAALCAVAASDFLARSVDVLGEPISGLIVLPTRSH